MLSWLPGRGNLLRKAHGYVRRANIRGVERMFSFQFLRTHPLDDIFEGDFLQSLGGYTVVDIPASYYSQAVARDHLDRLLYVDLKITLAEMTCPRSPECRNWRGFRRGFRSSTARLRSSPGAFQPD